MVDRTPVSLFRYRSLGASWPYLINELRGQLWLSKPEALNDPFDGCAFAPEERRQARIDGRSDTKFETKYNWCVACFSETWDNPTMWANYGSSHSGVCLSYDARLLAENVGKMMDNSNTLKEQGKLAGFRDIAFDAVEYKKELPMRFVSERHAIFSKLDSWKYEAEWRIAKKSLFMDSHPDPPSGTEMDVKGAIEEILCPENVKQANWQALLAVRDAFCPDVPIIRIKPVPNVRGYERDSTKR